jgi:hypothetical protein
MRKRSGLIIQRHYERARAAWRIRPGKLRRLISPRASVRRAKVLPVHSDVLNGAERHRCIISELGAAQSKPMLETIVVAVELGE